MADGPMFVDTHCHLVLLEERGLLDEALAAASAAGVGQVVSVGLNAVDSEANRILVEGRPGTWFTVGWHPHETHVPDAAQLADLRALLTHPRAVAVGEIGLDLFFRPGYHETDITVQTRGLHMMFELAEESGKPVILHDRDAHREILEVMRAHPRVRGVMHCFSGDAEFASACVAAGYVISLSGIVTFPRSDPIQEAARQVGAADYVVETDAPFLAPVPHRGRPNQPAFVRDTAAHVATLRGDAEAVVAAQTTATARRLFGLADTDLLS